MRSFLRGGEPKRLALAMMAVGVILIVASWRLMVASRGHLVSDQGEARTTAPTLRSGPLPTVAEPLMPTRTCTPLTLAAPVTTRQPLRRSVATPAACCTHWASSRTPTADVLARQEGSEATTIPPSPGPGPSAKRSTQTVVISGPSFRGAALAQGPTYLPMRQRFGVGVAVSSLEELDPSGRLGGGWYLNWGMALHPLRPRGMEFVQMIRVRGGHGPDLATVAAVVSANPGSLWLIGNEPDVKWQDNATPQEYARAYHELYIFLKERDPTCRVAIGGVSQPTPLRLQYLDMILENHERLYGERMPVDVWNTHAFILREERGSWGVDIPPGMPAAGGALYKVGDHDDLGIFAGQIVGFRRWMRDRGERNKPLIVSEYGILMPEDYGFPFERVRDFMYNSFDYFLGASDDELGYPADGNRLVQRWAWYSLSDTQYATGNLIDPDTEELTPLGLAYRQFISRAK